MFGKNNGYDISFKLERTAPKGTLLVEVEKPSIQEQWEVIDYYGERACGVPKEKIKRYKDTLNK